MKKLWIQRDGTPIKIKHMSKDHLKNSIAMLERRNQEIELEINSTLPWDFYFELPKKSPSERWPVYKLLKKELKKR